jgi:hypothetical protein
MSAVIVADGSWAGTSVSLIRSRRMLGRYCREPKPPADGSYGGEVRATLTSVGRNGPTEVS